MRSWLVLGTGLATFGVATYQLDVPMLLLSLGLLCYGTIATTMHSPPPTRRQHPVAPTEDELLALYREQYAHGEITMPELERMVAQVLRREAARR